MNTVFIINTNQRQRCCHIVRLTIKLCVSVFFFFSSPNNRKHHWHCIESECLCLHEKSEQGRILHTHTYTHSTLWYVVIENWVRQKNIVQNIWIKRHIVSVSLTIYAYGFLLKHKIKLQHDYGILKHFKISVICMVVYQI